MATAEEELQALEEEVQRIREKRNGGGGRETIRKVLNLLFLAGAVVGLYLYFTHEAGERKEALIVIFSAMMMKVLEFILRFTA